MKLGNALFPASMLVLLACGAGSDGPAVVVSAAGAAGMGTGGGSVLAGSGGGAATGGMAGKPGKGGASGAPSGVGGGGATAGAAGGGGAKAGGGGVSGKSGTGAGGKAGSAGAAKAGGAGAGGSNAGGKAGTTSMGGGGAGGGTATPCSKEGGHTCGGNGIPGDPNVLYVCAGGIQVPEKNCGVACETMPPGVPDQCPSPTTGCGAPQGLIDALSPKPYVEQSCSSTTWSGWPYEAQSCSYSAGGLSATVTTATPSADRVACWLVDSAPLIPALQGLKTTDPAAFEQGLTKIGLTTVLYQSSRIFPLEGGIIEDQGSGYIDYSFLKGVTTTCSSGCYCRVNSLHRTEWCTYVAGTGGSYDVCIAKVGTSGLTAGWGDECLQNHINAWKSDSNAHFRAKAFVINQKVSATCPSAGSCTSAEVLQAITNAL